MTLEINSENFIVSSYGKSFISNPEFIRAWRILRIIEKSKIEYNKYWFEVYHKRGI